MTIRSQQTTTTTNNPMPTVNKRLQLFYAQLKEKEGIEFQFSKTRTREIGNKVKRLYDRGTKRNPDRYPECEYVNTDEQGKKIRVRDYPEFFYTIIDVVIRQTFDQFKKNVEEEEKKGNLQPKQKVIGKLSRPLRPRNVPIHRQKRKDDENH